MSGQRERRLLALGICAGLAFASAPARAHEHDLLFGYFEMDQLEYRSKNGRDTLNWDAQGWYGGDDHKAWLKTEGEKVRGGKLENAEVQLLYSRRISEFFDLQMGARYDFRPEPERGFAVFGVQGIAPYFFEVEAAAFLSNQGELSARVSGEYDLLITQALVLQPKLEINLAGTRVRERGVGAGVNSAEFGLRLRYEFAREFAPYVGVVWERALAETARLARAEGERVEDLSLVAGVRFWF
jgi:copper resistance protein B